MPCPQRFWQRDLMEYFNLIAWDRDSRLPSDLRSLRRVTLNDSAASHQPDAGAEQLLNLLSIAVRVEPELLRAVRYLLPSKLADVGSEAAVWHHPDVVASPLGFSFSGSDGGIENPKLAQRREKFLDFPSALLRKQVYNLVNAYHAGLPKEIAIEESAIYQRLTKGEPPFECVSYIQRVAKTAKLMSQGEGFSAWARRLFNRQDMEMWFDNPALAAAWVAEHADGLAAGELQTALPPGVNLNDYSWLLAHNEDPLVYTLLQRGEEIAVIPGRLAAQKSAELWQTSASFLSELTSARLTLQVENAATETAQGRTTSFGLSHKHQADDGGISLPESGRLIIHSDFQRLTYDRLIRPKWADAIGRDHWGLYADFNFEEVTQRLRWIPPGRFLMGSPTNEAQRFDRESQYRVTITQGYWLAETACTQSLWQVVMKKNPSHFKGDKRPVEQVSWNDVKMFLDKLNDGLPELKLRLPTEAEWEYACRAGTTTAFAFGDRLSPEFANYNGNYPYAHGEKGEFREETIAVDKLYRNAWGLYQMHGNVWEWCEDWYGDYPAEPVENPLGPDQGVSRVLRGGLGLRSASHFGDVPGRRGVYFGFRLARGQ